MHVVARELLLAGIAYKSVAHQAVESAVVGGHPYVVTGIFAEAAHDVAAQRARHAGVAKGEKAVGHGREIVHAAVERAPPDASLGIAHDGIDKLFLGRGFAVAGQSLQLPLPIAGVANHNTLFATDEQSVGRLLEQRVDVGAYPCERRVENLAQTAVGGELPESLVPGSDVETAV